MVKLELLIQGYRKLERFASVGDKIIQVFSPLITEYELRPLKLTKEKRKKFGVFYCFNWNNIFEVDLLSCLEEVKLKKENSLLCITNWITRISNLGTTNKKDFFKTRIAACFIESKVAYVTTNTIATSLKLNKNYLEALTIESIHEIGHFFGLNHHDKNLVYGDEKLCPMCTAHYSPPKGSLESHFEFNNRRGTVFCESCKKKLSEYIE